MVTTDIRDEKGRFVEGYEVPAEITEKIRKSNIEYYKKMFPIYPRIVTQKTRDKLRERGKERLPPSKKTKRKMSKSRLKGMEEGRIKIWNRGTKGKGIMKPNQTSYKKGNIPPNKGKPIDEWMSKEMREKRVKKILKGLARRPTPLEQEMIEIIRKHHLPLKYTGDGSFFIGYKNPDFINCNGEKICVEVANTNIHHHPKDYPEKRKAHFAKYGWKCIVFMRDKLDEKEVLKELEGIQ